ILSDPDWRRGIGAIRNRDLACELEVFSTQLSDFVPVAAALPDIQFILPVMGWPIDTSGTGRAAWKRDLTALADRENVAVKIFGLECIFGVDWTADEVRPWILETIETFGSQRCMFASHMPITRLAGGMRRLYQAYFDVIGAFSPSEKRQLLHDTAARVYRL
ncbi:MAG TPA: amidohydrolase family protein, partial [Alphaproteobacteria bacterium]|nr:amidohydrolase family protein [Alphaproteobacteria bacterium]